MQVKGHPTVLQLFLFRLRDNAGLKGVMLFDQPGIFFFLAAVPRVATGSKPLHCSLSLPLCLHSDGSQRSVVVLVAAGRTATGWPSPVALLGSDLAKGPTQRHPQGPALHGPQWQAPVTSPVYNLTLPSLKLSAQLPSQQSVSQSVCPSVSPYVRQSAAGLLLPEDVQLHSCHFHSGLYPCSVHVWTLHLHQEDPHLLPQVESNTFIWKEKNKPTGKPSPQSHNQCLVSDLCTSVPLQLWSRPPMREKNSPIAVLLFN